MAKGQVPPSLAPLNPEFKQYQDLKRLEILTEEPETFTTGWIPPPIAPEVHRALEVLTAGALSDPVYDLRDPDLNGDDSDSLLTPITNQGSCGSCWAFATYGTYESLIKANSSVEQDYAENHLKHLHGFDLGPCEGGNISMSAAYFSRHHGPIDEADDPDDPTGATPPCTECSPVQYVDNVVLMPVRSSTSDNGYIKQAILDHGALYTSFYWTPSAFNSGDDTYYYTGSSSNHAVVIVGWDDTKVTAASQPGAFIVRNSWGSGWGENGYFYVSYYDTTFAFSSLAYIVDTHNDMPKKIYYHDPLGLTSYMGWGDGVDWGANVFVPDEDGIIDAVSFYATASNMSYEIYIYDDVSSSPTSFSSQLGTVKTGTVERAGYYTVRLNEAVPVALNDSFAVVVRFTTPGYYFPVPLEQPLNGYSSEVESSPGESYVSSNGSSWTDLTDWYPNANVCIKALAFVLKGDFDGDNDVTLGDAVLSLQISAGAAGAPGLNLSADVNGDGQIGLPDAIYVLQSVSGLRE
jgi:C1A family cysteine protease